MSCRCGARSPAPRARVPSSGRRQVPSTLGITSGPPWQLAGRLVSSWHPDLGHRWAEQGTGTLWGVCSGLEEEALLSQFVK